MGDENVVMGDENVVSHNAHNLRTSSTQLRPLPYDSGTPVKPQGKKMRPRGYVIS
jgi:hypothetical protein